MAPLRLVLDTNVVLDLFHFADPSAQPILAALEDSTAECWAEEAGIDELARVLTYPELCVATEAATKILARYRQMARHWEPDNRPLPRLPICKDPDDQKFLELAARVGADLLISKDKALLALARSQGLSFRIMTPAETGAVLTSRPPLCR